MANYSKKKAKTPFTKRLMLLIGDKNNAKFERECGLTANSINRYLDGNLPKLDVLEKISEATECPIEWLISGKTSNWVFLCKLYFPELKNVDNKKFFAHPYEMIFQHLNIFEVIGNVPVDKLEAEKIIKNYAFVIAAAIYSISKDIQDPWTKFRNKPGNEDYYYLDTDSLSNDIQNNLSEYGISKKTAMETLLIIPKIIEEQQYNYPSSSRLGIYDGKSFLECSPKEKTKERKRIRDLEYYIHDLLDKINSLEAENSKLKLKLQYIKDQI